MDREQTRLVEDTASNLNAIAGMGREAWVLLAQEIDQQGEKDEIHQWLGDIAAEVIGDGD